MVNYWHYTGDASYSDVTCNALVSQIGSVGDFVMLGRRGMECPHYNEFWHGGHSIAEQMTTKLSGCLMPWQQLNTGSRVHLHHMYAGICEKYVYERRVYEKHAYKTVVYGRCTPMRWPMGEARIYAYEMHACERRAYEMAHERRAHMRDTPMRWPL
jgi:hypothetical protein